MASWFYNVASFKKNFRIVHIVIPTNGRLHLLTTYIADLYCVIRERLYLKRECKLHYVIISLICYVSIRVNNPDYIFPGMQRRAFSYSSALYLHGDT